MPRPTREVYDGAIYHLICRGNDKKPVLHVNQGYERFKTALLLSKQRYRWKLYHYCLMPNHAHFIGQIEAAIELPRIMQCILQTYSRWYKKQTGHTGYLWQGRFRSPVIEKDSYLLECGRYVERNPVRAALSAGLGDYPWSSYRYYAYGESDVIIDMDPLYRDFGSDAASRQQRYREFVKLEAPYETLLSRMLEPKPRRVSPK